MQLAGEALKKLRGVQALADAGGKDAIAAKHVVRKVAHELVGEGLLGRSHEPLEALEVEEPVGVLRHVLPRDPGGDVRAEVLIARVAEGPDKSAERRLRDAARLGKPVG